MDFEEESRQQAFSTQAYYSWYQRPCRILLPRSHVCRGARGRCVGSRPWVHGPEQCYTSGQYALIAVPQARKPTRAFRGIRPKCLGSLHILGCARRMIPPVCLGPCCGCRIHSGLLGNRSRRMRDFSCVPGTMVDLLVNARRASVAMMDGRTPELQNAPSPSR